jgi:hypothetical protein
MVASVFHFIDALGGRLVHRVPWPIGTSADPARWDQMPKVVKEIERHGWRSDVRNRGTVIELAVSGKPNPHRNWIVIQANEADITLIKRGFVELVLRGKVERFALHATPKQDRKVVVLVKVLAP